MDEQRPQLAVGLEGVYINNSKICLIDGQKGTLLYRGYDAAELAEHSSHEETCFLLLNERLPIEKELKAFNKKLASERKLPKHVLQEMKSFSKQMNPMEALRTTVSSLGVNQADARKLSIEEQKEIGVSLIAKFPSIVASHHRIRQGEKPVKPSTELSNAGNFLFMLNGKKPDAFSEKALDTDLILHAEHELNASTFALRVAVSTFADLVSAITSGIATLKGPLHGGAAEMAMQMLKEIKNKEHARKYVLESLAKKERIMGFGHRVYKTMDPRAVVLKKLSRELGEKRHESKWFEVSEEIEKTLLEQKNLYPNVDFYAASVYHYLGITTELYTPIFAASRSAGWVAHALEQYADNRLIRPLLLYNGPKDLKYVPIEERK